MNWKQNARVATIFTAVALSGPFDASAHVKPGSDIEKYNMGFVKRMTNDAGTSCCHDRDVLVDLKETRLTPDHPEDYKDLNGQPFTDRDSDGKLRTHYRITLTQDPAGRPFKPAVVIDVPSKNVLTNLHVQEVCATLPDDDPDKKTCVPPSTSMLFMSAITPEGGTNDEYGHATEVPLLPAQLSTQWCYYPNPLVQ